IVFGYYGSALLFGMTLGAVAGAVADIIIALTIPTVSYLLGEWIGRPLAKQRDALLVAAVAPLFAISLIWSIAHLIIAARKETLEALQRGRTEEMQSTLPIIAVLTLLSVIIPMLVGAYRGAKYKPFYDLAFFAKRLPHQKQVEIEDFAQMIEREYKTTS